MRAIFLWCLILSFFGCVSAQAAGANPKIRLRNMGQARVSVTNGRFRATIDLSQDVVGCGYVLGKYKREFDKNGCSSPPANFKLIDAIVKGNESFLVIQSDAMGNCNVCGRCGASESYALIWLKLDARLRVADKKMIVLEDCLENISSLATKPDEDDNLSDLPLIFKKNVLTVEYEKTIFNENSDVSGYQFSRLEYNRKTPEKGFVVKTQFRENSSIREQ